MLVLLLTCLLTAPAPDWSCEVGQTSEVATYRPATNDVKV